MTAELDLDAITAREQAATPGPWEQGGQWDGEWRVMGADSGGVLIGASGYYVVSKDTGYNYADAEFIAAARTDVPILVAEVLSLRTHLAASQLFIENAPHDEGCRHDALTWNGTASCSSDCWKSQAPSSSALDRVKAEAWEEASAAIFNHQHDAGVAIGPRAVANPYRVRQIREGEGE